MKLLSLGISYCPDILGLTIFGSKVKLTQLADNTALFLKDKCQNQKALHVTNNFSEVSGLKFNINKIDILCIYETSEKPLFNIPVNQCVKYLGINISIDMILRQQFFKS